MRAAGGRDGDTVGAASSKTSFAQLLEDDLGQAGVDSASEPGVGDCDEGRVRVQARRTRPPAAGPPELGERLGGPLVEECLGAEPVQQAWSARGWARVGPVNTGRSRMSSATRTATPSMNSSWLFIQSPWPGRLAGRGGTAVLVSLLRPPQVQRARRRARRQQARRGSAVRRTPGRPGRRTGRT